MANGLYVGTPYRSQGGQRVSGIREVGRPEKEFNFFANFVPPFPENESEPYALEPEIKFLLSRKTSATNQKGGRATDARSAARDCAILRGEWAVKWREFLETVEAEKRSDDPIMSINKRCAISS